ncbi:MAG: hypothetical protein GXY83_11850 [Rhodopirellula sp.]|nr:hypothetical protein [Rhodopirellula sp.]
MVDAAIDYQAKYGFWRPVVEQSVTSFLKCGDLHEGFARVRCADCGHEMRANARNHTLFCAAF